MVPKQQFQQGRPAQASLLELEAAEYFKLDLNQMDLTHASSRIKATSSQPRATTTPSTRHRTSDTSGSGATIASRQAMARRQANSGCSTTTTTTTTTTTITDRRKPTQQRQRPNGSPANKRPSDGGSRTTTLISEKPLAAAAAAATTQRSSKKQTRTANQNESGDHHQRKCAEVRARPVYEPPRRQPAPSAAHQLCTAVGSSTTSTNSLPSITSSPSVSPSLVCPHLSLDDLLECRQNSSGSPHTIGLCSKCRLDPPPNIHSPLSPQYKPNQSPRLSPSDGQPWPRTQSGCSSLVSPKCSRGPLRRGCSDHSASYCSMKEAKRRQQLVSTANLSANQASAAPKTILRHRSDLSRLRDDSLDYCLEPSELRRMQLSPTMRNSVDYIRRNSIESGRVLRVYKNGEPYEKPLRVCILRGEFATITHLLDHIQSRLLVPLGARYLFHLDGQLVYSVHELKHGSAYLVSGTRSFDYRTSEILKEQQRREQRNQRLSSEQKTLIRQQLETGTPPPAFSSRQTNQAPSEQQQQQQQQVQRRESILGGSRPSAADLPMSQRPEVATSMTGDIAHIIGHECQHSTRTSTRQSAQASGQSVQRGQVNQPPVQVGPGTQVARAARERPGGVVRPPPPPPPAGQPSPSAAAAAAAATTTTTTTKTTSRNERPIVMARAKSELSALPAKKLKKNVTFKDTGRGSSPAISDLSSSGGETSSTNTNSTVRRSVSSSTLVAARPVSQQSGQQPLADDDGRQQAAMGDARKRDSYTMEVGIQVSDSIDDGFLIDLPVALPSRGDDSSLADRPIVRSGAAGGGTSRVSAQRGTRATTNQAASGSGGGGGRGSSGAAGAVPAPKPKQIVTITERQLSQEEMSGLEDLSAGDHHDHHEVIIKWGPAAATIEEEEEEARRAIERRPSEVSLDVVPDRTNTIAIGASPESGSLIGPGRLITSAVGASELPGDGAQLERQADTKAGQWQYLGGDAARSTPAERPVSQSGPSEMVRARVTTPTPSLSTGGDNNSLTLSYDTIETADQQQVDTTSGGLAHHHQSPRHAIPAATKQRTEVMGTLCDGLDAPAKNFRLVWVNGFAINDIYPENSVDVQRLAEPDAARQAGGRRSESQSPASVRLSPSRGGGGGGGGGQQVEFKPSERYHNWICHSKRHGELVYPAGALIVLWCRWTNEQRYYARHTANVSCLTLATLDTDLAASAQSRDRLANDKRNWQNAPSSTLIHLWSLSSLALLRVIEDDQFKTKLIFSMRLKSSKTSGCELSVAARDEKQLFLLEYSTKLLPTEDSSQTTGGGATIKSSGDDSPPPSSSTVTTQRRTSNPQTSAAGGTTKGPPADALLMRASKILQGNQLPLFVLRLPKLARVQLEQEKAVPVKQSNDREPLISFGRRHFSVWSSDVRQRKLRLMQADQKSARFNELIIKANCLCRISPDEFLLGDSEGNIAMLLISCSTNQAPQRPSATTGNSRRTRLPSLRADSTGDSSRYSIETVELLKVEQPRDQRARPGEPLKPTTTTTTTPPPPPAQQSISCLTRISGSLFVSADASCTVRFWRLNRRSVDHVEHQGRGESRKSASTTACSGGSRQFTCEQLSSISLPPDLGFICAILLAQHNLRESVVDFYLVSTSNTILFGSVKLPPARNKSGAENSDIQRQQLAANNLLANSSLSVVYEGHETSAAGLVADCSTTGQQQHLPYFTCSLDCRICKWNGKQLIWKSMLPSSCVSMAVHPTGCVLAVGSVDGTVYVLDKTTGLLISYFPLTPVRINCLAYSRDGSLLAAGCANGSIFMLPVDERGLKYRKVSIFQSPNAVVSLQFSLDNRYMLTSVSHGSYQELILWDLPNFRYMRDDVKLAADRIRWFDSICSGSEDVRAIWENAHLSELQQEAPPVAGKSSLVSMKRPSILSNRNNNNSNNNDRLLTQVDQFVINLSCHRLIKEDSSGRGESDDSNGNGNGNGTGFVIASDTRGYLRLFRYPAYDIQQGFYAARICSSAVNCCRFLQRSAPGHQAGEHQTVVAEQPDHFVSTSLDGSICLWALE